MIVKSKYPHSNPDKSYQDSLGKFYWQKLDEFSSDLLIIDYESGRKWTGEQVKQKASRVARVLLRELKINDSKSHSCYFYASNSDYLQVAALGCILAGCSVCVGAPSEPKTELAYMSAQVDPKVIFVASEHCKVVVELLIHERLQSKMFICLLDNHLDDTLANQMHLNGIKFMSLHQDFLDYDAIDSLEIKLPRIVNPNSPAYILFTSGSTGLPKPVARTHKNSLYVAHSFDTTRNELWDLNRTTVMAGHLHLDHGTGTFSIKMCLAKGYTLVVMDGYDFDKMLRAIELYKITDIMLGSALLHKFITEPHETFISKTGESRLASVRNMIAIGSPIASKKAALSFMDQEPQMSIRQAFGMTECGFISVVAREKARTDKSVGQLLPNLQLKLVTRAQDSDIMEYPNQANDDRPEEYGEKGELYVGGPTVSPGYMGPRFKRESGEVFLKDGFYKSNDVASISKDGELTIHGRYSEILCLYDGWKVLPQELEGVLAEHEGVKEVGVIGVPHPDLPTCHAPRAYVVPTDDWSRRLTAAHVEAYAKEHMSEFKQLLGGVVIVHEPLPRGSLQKLDRKKLYLNYKMDAQKAA